MKSMFWSAGEESLVSTDRIEAQGKVHTSRDSQDDIDEIPTANNDDLTPRTHPNELCDPAAPVSDLASRREDGAGHPLSTTNVISRIPPRVDNESRLTLVHPLPVLEHAADGRFRPIHLAAVPRRCQLKNLPVRLAATAQTANAERTT